LKIDFSNCEIITPGGDLLQSFYKRMWDVFPYDRPIYDILMDEGDYFYPMRNYALYSGTTLLGNSGIFPFKVWRDGQLEEIYGIGAVATMPEYRRQGVASRLLEHCITLIDSRNIPSVLFTELDEVYRPMGFEIIKQDYRAISVKKNQFNKTGNKFRTIKTLSGKDLETIARIYDSSPEYSGKVMRRENYWRFYKMMFDPYEKPEIVIFTSDGIEEGYARYEIEPDRLTVTELCSRADPPVIIDSLLGFLNWKSIEAGFPMLTLAMSPDHPIWKYLNHRNIPSVSEAEGVRREIFMMRKAADGGEPFGSSLFWSLSDKF